MAQANIKAVITAEDRASSTLKGFGDHVENLGQRTLRASKLAVTAFAAATAAATGFAVRSAADFEQSRIAFETMLGSADRAKVMLKEVSDFAAKTPFELPEVVTGAKQLLAYGFEAEKIIPTFKALGNIAAGVGKDKLPNLILAFGQVRAATRLTGMELRQFTEAGVPMLEMLAKQMGKTEAEIKDLVTEGKVGFPEVEKAIFGMSQEGGKFFNLMERQSKTFSGVMSNIKDNIGRVAREIVGISETGEIREGSLFAILSQSAQKLLKWLDDHKQQIIDGFLSIQRGIQDVLKWLGERGSELLGGFTRAWEYIEPSVRELWKTISGRLVPELKNLWHNVIEPLIPLIGAVLVGAVKFFIENLNGLINFILDHKYVIGLLAGAFVAVKTAMAIQAAVNAFLVGLGLINSAAIVTAGHIGGIQAAAFNLGKFIASPLGVIMIGTTAAMLAVSLLYDQVRKVNDEIDKFNQKSQETIKLGEDAVRNAPTPEARAEAQRELYKTREKWKPFEAIGGSVQPSRPYMVGEMGPEMFWPNNSGRIIPNSKMSTNNNNISLNVNIGMFANSPMERRRIAEVLFNDLKDVASKHGMSLGEKVARA